jgi:hypothetical protein
LWYGTYSRKNWEMWLATWDLHYKNVEIKIRFIYNCTKSHNRTSRHYYITLYIPASCHGTQKCSLNFCECIFTKITITLNDITQEATAPVLCSYVELPWLLRTLNIYHRCGLLLLNRDPRCQSVWKENTKPRIQKLQQLSIKGTRAQKKQAVKINRM